DEGEDGKGRAPPVERLLAELRGTQDPLILEELGKLVFRSLKKQRIARAKPRRGEIAADIALLPVQAEDRAAIAAAQPQLAHRPADEIGIGGDDAFNANHLANRQRFCDGALLVAEADADMAAELDQFVALGTEQQPVPGGKRKIPKRRGRSVAGLP